MSKRKNADNETRKSKKGKPSHEKIEEIKETEAVFADPTYDSTFKMLFGTEKNKDILINILNSLLGFKNEKEIKEVEIASSDLITEGISDVKGAVDILCTTKSNQKIAVEMQRMYKDYFLPRSQEYMSKLIIGQVQDGQGKMYDKVLMDTYILSIEKQNVFRGTHKLTNEKLFEVTVVPTVQETKEEVPGNKMHWKFFELPKFIKEYKGTDITKENSLKEQWLNFLVKCGVQKEVPDNVDDIIKRGYEIMKMANWTPDQRTMYWKQKANEADELREQKRLQEEIKEQAEKIGFDKGIQEGELKGKIKGEVSKVKSLIKCGVPEETIVTQLKFLTEDKVKEKFEHNFNYIQEHIDDSDSDICVSLGLIGSSSENFSEYTS